MLLPLWATLASSYWSCGHNNSPGQKGDRPQEATPARVLEAAPPLSRDEDPVLAALHVELAKVPPAEYSHLHNVYRLSDQIISGSEPAGEEGLREVAALGVRTIVSVDGKAPDAAAAHLLGMRYVHVPIKYSGISREDLLMLSKTFRELEGPFYVHCFHGKHRGPAAAALGRVLVDGASREQALAEMRQWCGTSVKYDGLYAAIASEDVPSAAATSSFQWSFPAVQPIGGFPQAMVEITRLSDDLKLLAKAEWLALPDHPDVVASRHAERLAALMNGVLDLTEVKERPAHFRDLLEQSAAESRRLADLLARLDAPSAPEERDALAAAAQLGFDTLMNQCASCHQDYRD